MIGQCIVHWADREEYGTTGKTNRKHINMFEGDRVSWFVLFEFIIYVPVNKCSSMWGRIEPVQSNDKCVLLNDTTQ